MEIENTLRPDCEVHKDKRQMAKYTLEQAMRVQQGSSASSLTSALDRGGL